jgi:hypothetical protein
MVNAADLKSSNSAISPEHTDVSGALTFSLFYGICEEPEPGM